MVADTSSSRSAASAGDRASSVRDVLLLMALAAVILGNQIQHEVFFSVDGVVYALIGKELSLKPIGQWVVLTWHGTPFFEHPHLTPWLVAVSMSLFGVRTLSAILPILAISLGTVWLAYALGRTLIDHRFGLLTGAVLTLTPEFVRGARNPMLEPALMFFVMLAVYGHVRAADPHRFVRCTVGAALSLALAFMAKGPPALLALAVIVGFQGAARLYPSVFERWRLPSGRLALHLVVLVAVPAAVVTLVDVWHRAVTGDSFFGQYISHQLRTTIVEGRGAATNDWFFYVRTFVRDWPWWPFALASLPLVAWRKDRAAAPALWLGTLVTAGTYVGFTAMTHKSEWYIAIHYVGSSLLAALTLRSVLSPRIVERYFAPFALTITVPLVLLTAAMPSLFLQYGRPFEQFMEGAHAELGARLDGEALAACVAFDPWKTPFFVRFYLGARKVDCGDADARYAIVDDRTYTIQRRDRLVFSQPPYAIVEKAALP